MDEQLLRQLEDMGLSSKEASVYVSSLMLGPATVQQIASQADIKRVTTYVILESLAGLGLVSQTSHGKKTFFTAEEPASLQLLLDKKEREITNQKNAFKALLPELEVLKKLPGATPTVKMYDTVEGLRSAMSSFVFGLDPKKVDYIYALSDFDGIQQLFPEIATNQGNPARIKMGIPSRLVYTSEKGQVYKGSDKDRLRESRWVPRDLYPVKGDLTVAGDMIMLISLDGAEPIGVTIKSAALATAMRAVFDLAWMAAEQYQV